MNRFTRFAAVPSSRRFLYRTKQRLYAAEGMKKTSSAPVRGVLVYNTYSTISTSKPSSYYMSMRKLVGFRKNHMRKRRNHHISINSYYRKNKGAIYNGFPPRTNVVLTSVPCLDTLCAQHRAKYSTNKKKVFCKLNQMIWV